MRYFPPTVKIFQFLPSGTNTARARRLEAEHRQHHCIVQAKIRELQVAARNFQKLVLVTSPSFRLGRRTVLIVNVFFVALFVFCFCKSLFIRLAQAI